MSHGSQEALRLRGRDGTSMRRGRLAYIHGCPRHSGSGAALAGLPAPGTHRGARRLRGA